MRDSEQTTKTAKDVLLITGTMLAAVIVVMAIGFLIIGAGAVVMSLGTVGLLGVATTLAIYVVMRLLTRRFRMLMWHGVWLIVSASCSLLLIGAGHSVPAFLGLLTGVVASALFGIRTTQRCADKALSNEFTTYADASGQTHKAIDLDITDLPGGRSAAGTTTVLIVAFLFLLAVMTWGTLINPFHVAPLLKRMWAVIFGAAAGDSFLTMVIVIVWIEQRFNAHVFMQPLPSEATRRLIERQVGRSPGVRNAVASFFGDLSMIMRDLYSVSVRR